MTSSDAISDAQDAAKRNLWLHFTRMSAYADSDDSLGHQQGWLYASIVASAYIVSRGLAKLGVREPEKDRDR